MPRKRKAKTKRRRPSVRRKRRRTIFRRRTTRSKPTVSDDDFIAPDDEDDDDDDDDGDYECSSGSSDIQEEAAQLIYEAPSKRRRTQSAGTSSRPPQVDELEDWEDEGFLIAVQNSLLDLENNNKVATRQDSLVPDQNGNGSIPVSEQNGSGSLTVSNQNGHVNLPEQKLDMTNAAGKISNTEKRKGKEKVIEEDDVGPVKQNSMAPEEASSVCGICLTEEDLVERGNLDCCDHFFCFDCIMEWAKVESRCPMCKQRFVTISKAGNESKRARKVRIPTRNQVYIPPEEDDMPTEEPYADVVCMECHGTGEEGLLLLCDRCDLAAHTFCVGLGRTVPQGDWFCRTCQGLVAESSGSENGRVDLDLVFGNSDSDNDNDVTNLGDAEYDEALIREIIASPDTENHRVRQMRQQPQHRESPPSRMLVRSNTRRRILRRLSGRRRVRTQAPPRLSRAARSLLENSGLESGILASESSQTPSSVSRAGSARTVPQQRMLQQRIQFMRNNWHLLQRGDLPFSSLLGNEEQQVNTGSRNMPPTTRSGAQAVLPSRVVIMSRNGAQPVSLTSSDDPKPSVKVASGPGESSSQRERELHQAWEMMYHAKSLLPQGAQCSSDRTNSIPTRQVSTGENFNSQITTNTPLSDRARFVRTSCDDDNADATMFPRLKPLDSVNSQSEKLTQSTLPDKANSTDDERNISNNDELNRTANVRKRETSVSRQPGIRNSVTIRTSSDVVTGEPSTSRQPVKADSEHGGGSSRNKEVNVGIADNRDFGTGIASTSKQPGITSSARQRGSSNNNSTSSNADRPVSSGRSAQEGLKVQLTEIVKKQIWPSYITESLGKDQFKQIARTAVHTLLALCDPQNESANISCHHPEKQGFSPIDNCCGKCFNEHVVRVVTTAKEKVVGR